MHQSPSSIIVLAFITLLHVTGTVYRILFVWAVWSRQFQLFLIGSKLIYFGKPFLLHRHTFLFGWISWIMPYFIIYTTTLYRMRLRLRFVVLWTHYKFTILYIFPICSKWTILVDFSRNIVKSCELSTANFKQIFKWLTFWYIYETALLECCGQSGREIHTIASLRLQ